jgi:hypothetical protein
MTRDERWWGDRDPAGPAHHREARDEMAFARWFCVGFCPQCARRLDGSSAEPHWHENYCPDCLVVWDGPMTYDHELLVHWAQVMPVELREGESDDDLRMRCWAAAEERRICD